jgi:hypothetical protein
VLRDLRVYRMIAAIVGEMEFECAIAIDAGIGKAQRKRASGPAYMQSHFPPARAVNRRLGLVIRDKSGNNLHDDNRGRHRPRLKIIQYASLLLATQVKCKTRCIPDNQANWVNSLLTNRRQSAILRVGAKMQYC